MNKRKLNKIEDNLVISIRYAILQKQLKGIKDKKEDSKANLIKEEVNLIKQNYSQQIYDMYNNEKFNKLIDLLTRDKNGLLSKYQIAIRTIISNISNYNDNEELFSNLSIILFNDEAIIQKIYKEHSDFCKKLAGKTLDWQKLLETSIITVGKIASHSPKLALLNILKFNKKKIISQGLMFIAKKFTQNPKFFLNLLLRKKHITNDEFTTTLCMYALYLSQTKQILNNTDYYRYYKEQIRYINKLREKIINELYIDWCEKENNYNNLLIFQRFDAILYNIIKEV